MRSSHRRRRWRRRRAGQLVLCCCCSCCRSRPAGAGPARAGHVNSAGRLLHLYQATSGGFDVTWPGMIGGTSVCTHSPPACGNLTVRIGRALHEGPPGYLPAPCIPSPLASDHSPTLGTEAMIGGLAAPSRPKGNGRQAGQCGQRREFDAPSVVGAARSGLRAERALSEQCALHRQQVARLNRLGFAWPCIRRRRVGYAFILP